MFQTEPRSEERESCFPALPSGAPFMFVSFENVQFAPFFSIEKFGIASQFLESAVFHKDPNVNENRSCHKWQKSLFSVGQDSG